MRHHYARREVVTLSGENQRYRRTLVLAHGFVGEPLLAFASLMRDPSLAATDESPANRPLAREGT
jgi:hypothetical protein